MSNRRFPPPWSVEDTGTGSSFVVKDSSGQQLAYIYYEEEPGRLGCQDAHKGRGPADCGQRGEATGATEAARMKERRERATLCHARAGSLLIEIKVCRRGPVSVRCCGSTVSSKRPGVYA